ncbi:serine/threonine protein kinase [Gloeomargarita lithophora Alchichica-D10]|uniref:Serine/threonine protein kinase n=1 Tax=Gloeomargarita lithophora Alchichica-D10 TaxID=1188229 RepID=A0A1J0AAC7_9CYAN|nr:ARC6/PARC6 family protein [Gloeomargarita lithophora]APB32896.1 serine/threonine protein kinase [Gloeomargarita lithophora Alchichica-D10]
MAVSYRQILLERDGQPLNQSQVRLLLRQALSQLQTYHDRHHAHGGVSLTTMQQVPNGCHLAPPTRTPTNGTPQQDLMALAQAAITLLTGYPPSPDWHWQEHCQLDASLEQTLAQMLAGDFSEAGQVLAVVVPQDFDPTEVAPITTPTPQTMPAIAPTVGSMTPELMTPAPVAPQPSPNVVGLLLLGLGLGVLGVVGGGLVWFLLLGRSVPFQSESPAGVESVPSLTPMEPAQESSGSGGGQKSTSTAVSESRFSGADGVALVASWLEAKKNVFAPPYDLDVAANFLTGPAWTAVAKQDGSVDWLRKNNTYYQYGTGQVTLKRVIQSTANQVVLDIAIQEQLNIYKNGRLRQSKTDRDTYRFDLRRVGDRWKIHDRRSVN